MSKKDSYWFKHDSSAGRALKMRKMSHIHGHWGKGVYWDVIEVLREQAGYAFDYDDSSLQMLSDLIGCKDEARFITWMRDCIKIGLLYKEGNKFFSSILRENMEVWEKQKRNGSQPKAKRKPNGSIRVEESIEDKSNTYVDFLSVFRTITGKAVRGDDKSKRQMKALEKLGHTIADFEKAIKNCYKDEYHVQNRKYLTPEFITRPDKFQKFLFAEDKPEIREVKASEMFPNT